jgi:hypothetical protein
MIAAKVTQALSATGKPVFDFRYPGLGFYMGKDIWQAKAGWAKYPI